MSNFFSSIANVIFGETNTADRNNIPYLFAEDDEVITTANGQVILTLLIHGIDGITSTDAEQIEQKESIETILNTTMGKFSFHYHKMYGPFQATQKNIHSQNFSKLVDNQWQNYIAEENLTKPYTFLTIISSTGIVGQVPIIGKFIGKASNSSVASKIIEIKNLASQIKSTFTKEVKSLQISDGSFLGFLRALSVGHYNPVIRAEKQTIAQNISTPLTFYKKIIKIDDEFDDRYAAVLTIKNYGSKTRLAMFDSIIDQDMIVSQSYAPQIQEVIGQKALTRAEQMANSNDAAITLRNELYEVADMIESGVIGFGLSQTSITIFGNTPEFVREKLIWVQSRLNQYNIVAVPEKIGLMAAWYSRFPDNRSFEGRSALLSSKNFTDTAVYNQSTNGLSSDELYWLSPITTFKTITGEPYQFSFHEEGKDTSEPPIGHTLVLGPSSSGKTLSTMFILTQAQRIRPRIIALDKDRGMEMAIKALGGQYSEVKIGQPTGLSPLSTETDIEGQIWFQNWLTSLLETTGEKLTPSDSEHLTEIIRTMANGKTQFQNFDDFTKRFTSFPGDVGKRVAEWGSNGRYSWVFGKAKKPIIDFGSAKITGLDIGSVLKENTERTALLAYIFRQIDKMTDSREPTFIVIDEAWQALDDPYFASMLKNWLVTMRKKNVIVIMLTQFLSQINSSAAGHVIIEAIPNRLIFPNKKATENAFDGLGLNDSELGFLHGHASNSRNALFSRQSESVVLDLNVGAIGDFATILGGGKAGEAVVGKDWRDRDNFWDIKGEINEN